MAYAGLLPFGEEAAFHRMGVVASILANANRDPKRRPEPYKPSDFEPKLPEPPGAGLDPDLVKAKFLSAFGSRIKTKPREKAGQGGSDG